jgi:hypothetical protein
MHAEVGELVLSYDEGEWFAAILKALMIDVSEI